MFSLSFPRLRGKAGMGAGFAYSLELAVKHISNAP